MPAQSDKASSSEAVILTSVDQRGVGTLTINRPAVNNAYNREVIVSAIDAVTKFANDPNVRVIVVRGNGKHFQAGADLKWVRANIELSPEENFQISVDTTNAIRGLNEVPKPTIALVHGGCFGGGTGIAAACDIVIASDDAYFAITEAKWGLMAAPIYPVLLGRMGARHVRRYSITCERFGAHKAKELGLVDEVCEVGGLDAAAEPIIDAILQVAPDGIATSKRSILECANMVVDDTLARWLARDHAGKRLTDEAIEGLMSFIEKRPASWYAPYAPDAAGGGKKQKE